ncbi:protease [Halobacteriales archaeon SW_7_68_16]|nr:MAG: protease [Halobacteriales archaeon SW_7_68_16]
MESIVGNLPLLLAVGGVVLMIAEAFAPGAHLIVPGVALFVAGLLGYFIAPLGTPLALAVAVVAFGVAAFYAYRKAGIYDGPGLDQTSDSDSLRGRFGRATEEITETGGEVKLDDGGFNPHYSARSVSGTIPEGTEVTVVDPGGGNVLTVQAAEAIDEDEIDRELARERDRSHGPEAESEPESA